MNQVTASGMDSRTARLGDSDGSGTDDSGPVCSHRDSVSTGGSRNADSDSGTDSGIADSGSIASNSRSFSHECPAAGCSANTGGTRPVRTVKAGKAKDSEDMEMSGVRVEEEEQTAQGKHLKKHMQ